MKPDIYIKIRFRTSQEGGRMTSVKCKEPLITNYYSCPLVADGKSYDCRLLIGGNELELGKYYEIPVIFLDRDLALPNLSVGKSIVLLEGKEVAAGVITKVLV